MKLVEINTVCGTGSTGRIALNIAKTFVEYGGDYLFAYGRGHSDEPNSYKISTELECNIHGMQTRILDRHGLGSKQSTKRLISLLNDYGPDVVHLHLLHGYYLNYELLFDYLKQTRISTLWTMHDCWAFTGHCPHFDRIGCNKWISGCYSCPLKKEYPSSYFFDSSKANYQKKKNAFTSLEKNQLRIVTPSKWLANLIESSFLNRFTVSVIPNGIDLNRFHKTEGTFRKKKGIEDKIVLLSVANGMDYRKGLNMLSDRYQIVIVGGISEKVTIPDNIMVIEHTDSIDELVDIYSSSDIFLNLTLEDNFPTVNLEALACGLPVVTYNTGGSPESITDDCGIVVEQHDLNGVLNAVEFIYNQSDYSAFSKRCRIQAEKYDMNQCFKRYAEIIMSMEKRKA